MHSMVESLTEVGTVRILRMATHENRNRDGPKMRWRDLVKDDMARNQMTTEMAEDRQHWHVMVGPAHYQV